MFLKPRRLLDLTPAIVFLLVVLFQARLAGASSSDAVRQAHIAVLQSLRKKKRSTHPYTWGAFVAAGDYR